MTNTIELFKAGRTQWGARSEHCRVLFVLTQAPLFFSPCFQCFARASVCGHPLYSVLSLSNAIPTYILFLSSFPSLSTFLLIRCAPVLRFAFPSFHSVCSVYFNFFFSPRAHAGLVRWVGNVVNYFTRGH